MKSICCLFAFIVLTVLSGCKKIEQTDSCKQFDKVTCNDKSVDGSACVFDLTDQVCVSERDCLPFKSDPVDCNSTPGCGFYLNLKDVSNGVCLSDRQVKSTCEELSKDECDFYGLASSDKQCVFTNNSCRQKNSFGKNGFNNFGEHINGTLRDDRGFDAKGKLANGATRDARGFDFLGIHTNKTKYDKRGFNVAGLYRDGTKYDRRGFDVAGIYSNGTDRDARGFNLAGVHSNGTRRDARGFDLAGVHGNGTRRDARGFDLAGVHTNGTARDDRGFNLAGVHTNGTARDARGFDLAGVHTNGTARDDRGFDLAGVHTNGTARDDRGFNLAGVHTNGTARDARGFNLAGVLLNGSDRDARGFNALGVLASGARRDNRGFNIDGIHSNGTNRDARGFDLAGSHNVTGGARDEYGFDVMGRLADNSDRDARGFNANGFLPNGEMFDPAGFDIAKWHKNGTKWDDRGFDFSHTHRNGTDRDDRGFDFAGNLNDGSARDARGFDANGRRLDGSLYDANGFDARRLSINGTAFDDRGFGYDGRHKNGTYRDGRGFNRAGQLASGALHDARGFDANGIHQITGTALGPDGQSVDGFTTLGQVREKQVGKKCYIPGANDYLNRPDRRTLLYRPPQFANAEEFVRAIEDSCRRFNSAVPLNHGQTLMQKRRDLVTAIKGDNPLYQAVVAMGAPEVEYNLQRGVDSALHKYVQEIHAPGGVGPYSKTSRVRYAGEEGIDAGGLTKDFLDSVSVEMEAMFSANVTDSEIGRMTIKKTFDQFNACTVAPNRTNFHCWNNLGQVIGKLAFVDDIGSPRVNFSFGLLSSLLGRGAKDPADVLALFKLDNPAVFDAMMQMLTYDADGLELVDADFSGLKENGENIPVDDTNVLEYVELNLRDELFPKEGRWIFSSFDTVLENVKNQDINLRTMALLLEGAPASWDMVQPLIRVEGGTNIQRNRIKQWFEEIVQEKILAEGELSTFLPSLLRWWTGSSAPPGTGSLRILISNLRGPESLPESHTCFNRFDVPVYLSKEAFKRKLIQAIEETGGFEIG